MKSCYKIAVFILCMGLLTGCGKQTATPVEVEDKVEDISTFNADFEYSYIVQMGNDPYSYKDKIIRAKGLFGVQYVGDNTYYGIVVYDQMGCCSVALEFVPTDTEKLPADGEEIVVQGKFGGYREGDNICFALMDAEIINDCE